MGAPVSSKTRTIIGAVKTALAGINGSAGGYVHDLSGAGRVKGGRPPRAAASPCAWVALGTLDSRNGPLLTRRRRDLVIDIEARAPASSADPEERGLIAADLLDDITRAVEADPRLGGLVLEVEVTGMAVDGDEAGMPGMAVAVAQVGVYWHATPGQGV